MSSSLPKPFVLYRKSDGRVRMRGVHEDPVLEKLLGSSEDPKDFDIIIGGSKARRASTSTGSLWVDLSGREPQVMARSNRRVLRVDPVQARVGDTVEVKMEVKGFLSVPGSDWEGATYPPSAREILVFDLPGKWVIRFIPDSPEFNPSTVEVKIR